MDENQAPIVARVLSWCLLALDILVVHIKVLFTVLHALYQVVVPPEEKSVAGEKVLITGTGHGIGKELARQYGELGAEVICVDVNEATNLETVKELRSRGIKAHAFVCDVSKRVNVLELGKRVKAEVGDVTILINNAGIMPARRLEDHKAEVISKIFDINVMAHFWLFEVFLPSMMEKNYGHVVGISSVAGLVGAPNVVPYCASKFAVRGLMEATAEEFRKDGRSVKFTTIFPHMVDTGLCKDPKNRFPALFDLMTPEYVASSIISAQRRGCREASIPGYMKGIQNLARLLPERAQEIAIDFVDISVGASTD